MPPGPPSVMTMKRINREIADLKKEDLGDMALEPTESNVHVWKGTIPGPQGSVYDGGVFDVEIVLPSDYPFSAPKVMFKTRIYHMNISDQGNICIDILKTNWSPALSLFKVMLSLSSLLTDPNPKDPLVPSIANQYVKNRKSHDATARQWTESYARPKAPPPPPPAVVRPPSPKPTKGKGRRVTESGAPNGSAAGSSSGPSRSNTHDPTASMRGVEIIELDSDYEDLVAAANPNYKKRKRPVNPDEVLDIADEEEETKDTAGSSSKKSRTRKTQNRTASGAGSSTRRSARHQQEDVIIVDDDDN